MVLKQPTFTVLGFSHLVLVPLARFVRAFVAWILAGLSATRHARDVDTRIATYGFWQQAGLISLVLTVLTCLTVIFAQAGIGGVFAFWGALVFVLR